MNALHPLTQPLDGRCLIEASAGTGKTYAITSLVLRLLLGHDGVSTGVNPLPIEQVLIVTFTRAATEELRGRIRERLQLARAAFAPGAADSADEFIAALRDVSADRAADHDRLALAAMSLDLSSIFTIHGFAGRVLQRHAFESGASFAAGINEDDRHVVDEALLDFWRERVYPLDGLAASFVLGRWDSPGAFIRDVQRLIHKQDLAWLGLPARGWDDLLQALTNDAVGLRASAAGGGIESMRTQFAGILKSEGVKAIDRLCAALSGSSGPSLDAATLGKLKAESLASHLLKKFIGRALPAAPLLADAQRLFGLGEQLAPRLLHDAVTEVSARLAVHKARTGELGFEDLLRLLAEGLAAPGRGDVLARDIRASYPVALVDECQDTDPLQWQVFDRLYRDAGALFLVGDPKQAIYAFRGADVYAYLQSRQGAATIRSLAVSYRSTQALVTALNELFALREDGDSFRARGIGYTPVSASGNADSKPLLRDHQPVPPLQFIEYPGDAALGSEAYRDFMIEAAADAIAGMLASAAAGRMSMAERPLAPGDIACLVRNWRDATPLVRALSRRGVPCVSRARASVYEGAAAASIAALLRAVLEPRSERALRAALGSVLAGRDAAELDACLSDEAALFALQDGFLAHRERLRTQGVQAMFRRLFFALDIPARALRQDDGDRLLTDSLHLVELLALERATLDSDEALAARFAERMAAADGQRDEQQLRLESDARRVRILTIHASKGLEFPVVVLPLPVQFRASSEPLYHERDSLRPVYDLGRSSDSLARADSERLAEDLRLLYVALTRAKYSCILGVADVVSGRGKSKSSILPRTALGWLLEADRLPPAQALARLHEITGATVLPPQLFTQVPPLAAAATVLAARALTRSPERGWSSTSYSALSARGAEAERIARVFHQQPEAESAPAGARRREPEFTPFGFPRGPDYGSMLHTVLERADLARPAAEDANAAVIRSALARTGLKDRWQPVVESLLDELRDCAIDGQELCLAGLARDVRVAEMSFELPVAGLDAAAVNALMWHHEPLARRGRPLDFSPMRGMLTGSIDLVFCHRGRYYVADFKSNHLGDALEDYRLEGLQAAVAEHRYDLQYTLYTLALVRHLRSRLGADFDYDTHIGGVFYLFLRGIRRADGNRQGVFHTRPRAGLIAALERLFDGVPA